MWAGSVVLRIGEQRDLLVAIQIDTASGLERVRTLFEPWLEVQPTDDSVTNTPVFSVRLEPVEGPARTRGAGLRPVPQLRFGSSVITRSREPDDILRALALVLGGAHIYRRDDGRVWMNMRPFARDHSVVLVDLEWPAMVNDRLLAQAGVLELGCWSTVIERDGSVAIPPPLPGLAWAAIAIEPLADEWQRFQLAGIVGMSDHETAPAELVTDVARRSIDSNWFSVVAAMAETGSLVNVSDRPALRDRVRMLLGAAGP